MKFNMLMIAACTLAAILLLFANTSLTESFTVHGANITFYDNVRGDDNGIGKAGVILKNYPISVRHNRRIILYPVAVHHDHFKQYRYSVLVISPTPSSGLKPIYGHVVDLCDRKDAECNKNVAAGGRNFLIDIHASAIPAMGAPANGKVMTYGNFLNLGKYYPSKMPPRVLKPSVLCPLKTPPGKWKYVKKAEIKSMCK